MTDKARECTHMVATRVTRTVKFLSGISVCDHIVTPEWVEQSGKGAGFVKEGAFALCDRKTEEMFGMDLASSLARAKGKKLLKVRSKVKVHCMRLVILLRKVSLRFFFFPLFPSLPLSFANCDVCDTLGERFSFIPLSSHPSSLSPSFPVCFYPSLFLFYHSSLPFSSSHTYPPHNSTTPPSLSHPHTGFLSPLHSSCPTSPQLIQGNH